MLHIPTYIEITRKTAHIPSTFLASFSALMDGLYAYTGVREYLANSSSRLTSNISSISSFFFATVIDYMVYGENIDEGFKELSEKKISNKARYGIYLFNLLLSPGAFFCFAAATKMSLIPFLGLIGISVGTGGLPLIIIVSALATIALAIVTYNTLAKLCQKQGKGDNKEYLFVSLYTKIKSLFSDKSNITKGLSISSLVIFTLLLACQIASIVGTFTFLGPIGLAVFTANTSNIISALMYCTLSFYMSSEIIFNLRNACETLNTNFKNFIKDSSAFLNLPYKTKINKIYELYKYYLAKPFDKKIKDFKTKIKNTKFLVLPILFLNIFLESLLKILQKTWLQTCLLLHCVSIGLTTSKAYFIPTPFIAASNAIVEMLVDWNYVNKNHHEHEHEHEHEHNHDHNKVANNLFFAIFLPVLILNESLDCLVNNTRFSIKNIWEKWCNNSSHDHDNNCGDKKDFGTDDGDDNTKHPKKKCDDENCSYNHASDNSEEKSEEKLDLSELLPDLSDDYFYTNAQEQKTLLTKTPKRPKRPKRKNNADKTCITKSLLEIESNQYLSGQNTFHQKSLSCSSPAQDTQNLLTKSTAESDDTNLSLN